MAGTTKTKVSARDRARAARRRADAARAERDAKVEAAATAYFTAEDERARLLAQIAALGEHVAGAERRMGAGVTELSALGESAAFQRELLGVDEPERKRLRALGEEVTSPHGEQSPALAPAAGDSAVVAAPTYDSSASLPGGERA